MATGVQGISTGLFARGMAEPTEGTTPLTCDTMQVNRDLESISHDRDLTMKIMKKRQEELARRSRLMDPRGRQFGADHTGLDAQVRDKQATLAAEKAQDRLFAQNLAAQELVLQTVEGIKEAGQRQKQRDSINHSLQNLSKEQRREYHLSDPKEYHAGFLTHPIEALGPSSMTKFQGESVDLEDALKGKALNPEGEAKKKQAQAASAQWLKQQMQEKRDREQAERDFDRYHDLKMAEANILRSHCEAASMQESREDKILEAQDNLKMAEDRRQREKAKKQRDLDLAQQHVGNVKYDPRMNEAHDNILSYSGKKLDQKRLTLEEEQDVYNTRAHQMRDKMLTKKREAEEEAEHHRQTQMGVEVRGAIEHRMKEAHKAKNRSLVEENQRLAEAKRAADAKERRAHKSFDYEP